MITITNRLPQILAVAFFLCSLNLWGQAPRTISYQGVLSNSDGSRIPEVVAYEENGIDAKSVDYARLVTVLIEAVKAQQEQIEQLQETVRGLLKP